MISSNEVVLLYNIQPQKLNKIKFVLIRMGVRIKMISSEMYLQPIGYLVRLKGFEQSKEEYNEVGFTDEMMVMRGFSSQRIDELLTQLKNNGIEKIQLKAIITEYNQNWNSIQLYEELIKENKQMSSNQ